MQKSLSTGEAAIDKIAALLDMRQPCWGRDYISVKLDDPSLSAPAYANLFDDEGGDGYTLIWSRNRKPSVE